MIIIRKKIRVTEENKNSHFNFRILTVFLIILTFLIIQNSDFIADGHQGGNRFNVQDASYAGEQQTFWRNNNNIFKKVAYLVT